MEALISQEERALAQHCLEYALEQGASQVRITLTKSLLNLTGLLNGQVDKVAHALDRSLQLQLFVDGRYGSFSSNRLEKEGLEAFVKEAIGTVKMLEPDPRPGALRRRRPHRKRAQALRPCLRGPHGRKTPRNGAIVRFLQRR